MEEELKEVLLPPLIAGDAEEAIKVLKDHVKEDFELTDRVFNGWKHWDDTVDGVFIDGRLFGDYFGAMVIAALKGYLDILQLLIEFPLFKMTQDQDQCSEFAKAAKNGEFDRIKVLLDAIPHTEEGPFLKGYKGHNIMNMCLLNKSCPVTCLQTLIDHGIYSDGWDFNGFTPLMCAILAGNMECLRFLMENGVDPYTPHLKLRKYFRKDGGVIDTDTIGGGFRYEGGKLKPPNVDWVCEEVVGPTALIYAATTGNIPILELMLEVTPRDLNQWGRFEHVREGPLWFAARFGSTEAAASIVKYRDAWTKSGTGALCNAIRASKTDLFELLLEAIPLSEAWKDSYCGFEGNQPVSDAFVACILERNPQYLSRLLQYVDMGVFEMDGGRALFTAIAKGAGECVKVFVQQPGFSVDEKCSNTTIDEHGLTSLMQSCVTGRDEIVQIFLEMGANVNIVDKSGKTAVMYTAQNNRVKCMELLMDAHADLDSVALRGETVFSAALMGHGSCLEVLLKEGKLLDREGLNLKPVHRQSLKAFGGDEKDTSISVKSALILMQYNVFEWNWCPMVNKKSLHSFVFAAVTSGILPGTFSHKNQTVSPLSYAFLIKDVALLRYLLANRYFLPDDYTFLLSYDNLKFDDSSELAFLLEQLTLQPGLLKNLLKFKTHYCELCPRHWRKLGPRKGEGHDTRFDVLLVNGEGVGDSSLEKCKRKDCKCDGLGMTLRMEDIEGGVEKEEEDEEEEEKQE